MGYQITSLSAASLSRAKWAYTTRRVNREVAATLVSGNIAPRPGDVVLARVEKIGQHSHLELAHGRRAHLLRGDEIVVCYGNRYAPDQFEAFVPDALHTCHLAAAGGIASLVASRHSKIKRPTAIKPLGLVGDCTGKPLNLEDWALPSCMDILTEQQPPVIAVVGTAMNAGKTTTAAYLVSGLVAAGLRVGSAKITGTGAGGDRWYMIDAGADPALDFVDAGLASTFHVPLCQLQHAAETLLGHLGEAGVDAIVLELADGLYQAETAALLRSPRFTDRLDGMIFTAGDAMGASSGVAWLQRHDLPLLAISGLLTASPLAVRETQQAIGLPVLTLDMLGNPACVLPLLEGCLASPCEVA